MPTGRNTSITDAAAIGPTIATAISPTVTAAMSSFQRVFDIPEVVDLLISQLNKPEVSILPRTNKTIRRHCTPWLYKAPDFRHDIESMGWRGNNDREQDHDGLGVSSDGLMGMPRRQELLVNLETLALWGLSDHAYVSNILSILGHCPNIVKLATFDTDNEQTASIIAGAKHFARLERLYLQVGRLTQLRILQLLMVKLDGEYQLEGTSTKVEQGIWNHLAGLKKLERIAGSIDIDNVETKVTSEWRKAVWMYEYWPRLQTAYL
ncbi:hypothetical protein KI688_010796 [Linnemannia hyalina]|uniref:Uncharacterized protein n=1 Tax=Linnemannia hyalina TaxID=64524 RepID=A0A9P7XXN6_9FUNG|nr:hypothetical protein KI688_010796 [Linnemannia hyalina]